MDLNITDIKSQSRISDAKLWIQSRILSRFQIIWSKQVQPKQYSSALRHLKPIRNINADKRTTHNVDNVKKHNILNQCYQISIMFYIPAHTAWHINKRTHSMVPFGRNLPVLSPWMSHPLPCKNHMYVYKITPHRPLSPLPSPQITHTKWVNDPWLCIHSLQVEGTSSTFTNLQILPLLTPMPRDRNRVSVWLKEHQQLGIMCGCIPDLNMIKHNEL